MFQILPENKKIRFASTTSFVVCCIPTGSVSRSVMLLITIEGRVDFFIFKTCVTKSIFCWFCSTNTDSIHLYTGQFTQCREVILAPIVLRNKHRLNDIHVDNSMANFRRHGILSASTRGIQNIVG